MKTWIVSDLHFGHKNVIKFCPHTRAHFEDEHEMDRALIKEWQEKVHPSDTIIDLGDFSFHNATATRNIIAQLPGYKIHVWGNHDNVIKKNVDIAKMFDETHEYLEYTHNGTHCCMFHYPIAEFNKMHRGSVHFHGHLHGKTTGLEHFRIRDVGWDVHGKILLLDDVIADALCGEIKNHHN